MKARKDNKVYQILPQDKGVYLQQGFDIYDDGGKLVEYSPLKKITLQQHLKALEKLRAKLSEAPIPDAQIDEYKAKIADLEAIIENTDSPASVGTLLQNYANHKGIDVGSATTAKGVLDKILDAEKD